MDVTHYIQDKSLRHRIVLLSLSNSKLGKLSEPITSLSKQPSTAPSAGIRALLLRAVFMLLACLLYVVETVYYDYFTETGGGIYDYSNMTTLETITLQ